MRRPVFWSAVLAAAALSAATVRAEPADGKLAEAATDAAKANEADNGQAGEPMVAPVKRVAPKTPVLSDPLPAKPAHKTAVIVPSRPNCDAGFKVDETGKSCVPVSSGGQKSKSKAAKASAKKKR